DELELVHIVGEATGRAWRRTATERERLMEDLQMGRVHRVFHRLQPVCVELRLQEQTALAIFADPQVVWWDLRRRLRPEVRPVHANELLNRVRLDANGQI